MEIIVIALAIVALAYWQESPSLNILAGIVAIAFGLYWMNTEGVTDFINIVIGVAGCLIGLHLWISTAIYFLGGRNE
jgi:drug/metabolite transporter (DMT)-like permease